jgi:hypothetical protein
MAWERIHRTVGGNGQVTVNTGYLTETVQLLDWSGGANNGVLAYTSPINIPIKGDITVLVKLSSALAGDCEVRLEHSVDGTNWFVEGQQNTTAVTSAGAGTELAKLAFIDRSAFDEEDGWWTVFDIDTHGFSPYTRIGFLDTNGNESGKTATVTLYPQF